METKHWFPLRVKVIDFGKEGERCLSVPQLVCSFVAAETDCRGVEWKEVQSSKSECCPPCPWPGPWMDMPCT